MSDTENTLLRGTVQAAITPADLGQLSPDRKEMR